MSSWPLTRQLPSRNLSPSLAGPGHRPLTTMPARDLVFADPSNIAEHDVGDWLVVESPFDGVLTLAEIVGHRRGHTRYSVQPKIGNQERTGCSESAIVAAGESAQQALAGALAIGDSTTRRWAQRAAGRL